MKPTNKTKFLPISELANYSDPEKWFCCAVVFSPETENQHFYGCPPYIEISQADGIADESLFFEVPEIVAYYAKTHPCYTMEGMQRRIDEGKRLARAELKNALGFND